MAVSVLLQQLADNPHSRLARRGGIKRISGTIYDEARQAMVDRLKAVCFRVSTVDVVWTNPDC